MSKKLLYFGKDEVYFRSLESRLKDDGVDGDFSLENMFFHDEEDKNLVTSLVSEIVALNCQIILVDFSIDKDKVSLLARHLRLTLNPKDTALVGLLNQVEKKDEDSENSSKLKKDFLQASLTHIPIIHYKGTSLGQILFDCNYLYDGDTKLRPTYATYKNFKWEQSAKYFSSLTHVMKDHLIVETSLDFENDDIIEIESDFLVHLDRKNFKVERKSTELLQTKFSKRYRLNMIVNEVVDPGEVVLGADEEQEETSPQYKEVDRDLFAHYISSLDKTGQSKKVKLLLVQEGLEVLQQLEKSLSDLPYLIRYQTSFRKNLKVVTNFRPHVIAIELSEKVSEIDSLVEVIKGIEDYNPVINIFNTDLSGEDLRERLEYPSILTHKGEINLSLLLNMLEIYDKKFGNFDPSGEDPFIDSGESPFQVYALNPMSRIKLALDIEITSLSEHEVTFLCHRKLPERGILLIESPVKMYITIVKPIEKLDSEAGKIHYFGLINGITSLELQKIRQYVNDLFLSEKREKEREEKEAFSKLNQDKKGEKDEKDNP